jgi:threonine synthase
VVPDFFQTRNYQPQKAISTISNAMDVGNPSNFVRILELFNNQFDALRNALSSYSISDAETKETIKEVFEKESYLLDPHGAVAWCALKKYLKQHPEGKGILLETAHPVKFYDVVEPVIEQKIPIPENIKSILNKEKESVLMQPDFEKLKEYLLNKQN